MSELSKLDAPSIYPGEDTYKKKELAFWLSDFHLIAFLQTTQLFSVVCCNSFTFNSNLKWYY